MSVSYIRNKAIQPRGYLQVKMKHDLERGFVGHLPRLVPEIMIDDRIYGENRRGKKISQMKLGVAESDVEGSLQLQWWNSESQSNWLDGFIRHAFYVGDAKVQAQAKMYVDEILQTQDEDGYLGIYQPDVRYNHTFESGELWAQTTLFRSLIGYYQFTGDEKVLEAIQRAVSVTMESYPINQSNPFLHEQSHGLTFVDVLLALYRYTGDKAYIEYGAWLYRDFSASDVAEHDVQEKKLESQKRFSCHGVHTYEHLRGLLMYYVYEQTKKAERLLTRYLSKLNDVETPSGGVIGDEWIAEKIADSELTGYEYCSLHEAFHSLMELSIITGEMKYADRAEWLFWNAAQGARHPQKSAIAYLKSDDSYEMMGDFHRKVESVHKVQTRYKYSAVHQDAAVCCVPMAGRISPYYLDYSVLKKDESYIQMLYADMEVHIQEDDVTLDICMRGNYPFATGVELEITSTKDIAYFLRRPAWAVAVLVNGVMQTGTDCISLQVQPGKQMFQIQFEKRLEIKQTKQEKQYVIYGPLLYALSLEHEEKMINKYNQLNFEDVYYRKRNVNYEDAVLKCVDLQEGRVIATLQTQQGEEQKELLPIGETILRKVAFDKER